MAFLRWSKAAKLNGRRKLVNRIHVLGRKRRFLVTTRGFYWTFFLLFILFFFVSIFFVSSLLFLHQRDIWRGELIYLTLGLDSFQQILLICSAIPPHEEDGNLARWINGSACEEDLFGYSSVWRAGG
ncbi:hypothetical protein BO85DRAFT_81155 [Aspergillus piperis CBS 112811]|uniref:Uncharacterized protein n=1 Tax=Aspergillus piperis CBS 112811 TaxID=1448313 RepID=A0A8G1VJ38_9EURO|nr:hypothetical protein BO85DRAFT_81155 [Aspergillus piperis CBS 112811]RAH55189.1 hypothetical protein BO85DRAFT_81155 [Aspergillus piperis CBS 112811]